MSMYYMNPGYRMRLGGLASGLDTDTMVKDLMRLEQMKVDRLIQQRQVVEWRKEEYRKNTDLLRGFYNEHFDLLYSKNNMTSQNAYNTLKITPSDDKYLFVSTGAGAIQKNMTITEIELASAASVKSKPMEDGVSVTKPLAGDELSGLLNLEGHSITMTVDGVSKIISFDKVYGGEAGYGELAADFQNKIDKAFGPNRVEVQLTSDNRILLNAETSNIRVSEHPSTGEVGKFGFGLNQGNRIDLNSTLLGLQDRFGTPLEFDDSGNVSFTINGEDFTFSSNDTLRTVIARVNSSKAGVTLSYSTLTDSFQLTNNRTGAAETLTFDDKQGNLLESLGLKGENIESGHDAKMVIDGQAVHRGTNSFTIDGITYNLTHELKATEAPVTLTAVRDVDGAFENIKNFVESYNKIIESINVTLSEEKFRDYPPLTESQKADMKDKDIELWQEKARSGILQRDPILQRMVYDMRRALSDPVKGSSITLSSIGITTGDWTEGGKLHIDEAKLKKALNENSDEVTHLFSNRSETNYSPDNTGNQRATRYNESGLAHRISDILQDNIRTTRDKNGKKGTLLEKAGMVGDASDKTNLIEEQLKNMNKRIDQALDRMYRAETRYWAQFTAMERAMQQMSSQSLWLAQQFGGGMY